ncbi:MAG: hypothetical protein CMA64_06495 [Euryarchaeota archaeon]|nr:hypothetical protein [Euryarchaeota archaeon]
MSDKPKYQYILDDETQELLDSIMNWAQRFVDMQDDDVVYKEYNEMILDLGDRFNMERNHIEYEETRSDDGSELNVRIKIIQDGEERALTPEQRRKMLKLVDNDPPHGDADIITHLLGKDEEDPTKH